MIKFGPGAPAACPSSSVCRRRAEPPKIWRKGDWREPLGVLWVVWIASDGEVIRDPTKAMFVELHQHCAPI
jgi:hypothetical protein